MSHSFLNNKLLFNGHKLVDFYLNELLPKESQKMLF